MKDGRRWWMLSLMLTLLACGDDDSAPMITDDAGMDAMQTLHEAGPAPMCGAQHCGSPLVGAQCCTRVGDVGAGAADEDGRCGADLGAVIESLAGTCVELRRAGTLDDQCPPRVSGELLEPGCCMADGFCGTLNSAADLGCQRVLDPTGADGPSVACGTMSEDAGQADAR